MVKDLDNPYGELPVTSATPPDEKPKRGCLFYGCITMIVLAIVGTIVLVIASYSIYRYIINTAVAYTETAPMPLPKSEMPPEQYEALKARVEAFEKALDDGEAAELQLTGDDINAIIANDENYEEFRDTIFVSIDGDEVKGKLSFPLSKITGQSELKDRYLNGEAGLKISLANGLLLVTVQELTVKGEPVEEQAMQQLRQKNLAESAYNDAEAAAKIQRFESIVVKDGTITVKSRARTEAEKAEADADVDAAKGEGDEPKAIEATPAPDTVEPAPSEPTPAVEPPPAEPTPAPEPPAEPATAPPARAA